MKIINTKSEIMLFFVHNNFLMLMILKGKKAGKSGLGKNVCSE